MPTMRVAMERFKIDHSTFHNVYIGQSYSPVWKILLYLLQEAIFFSCIWHSFPFSGEYILLHININALYLLQRNIVFSFFLLYGALIPNIDHHRPTLWRLHIVLNPATMFQYQLADYSVRWAKHRPVYKHLTKDRWCLWIVIFAGFWKVLYCRVIFWNSSGWCITATSYLNR